MFTDDDVWYEFYQEARDEGMNEDEARSHADDMMEEHLCGMADSYRVDMKYGVPYENF